MTSRAAIESVLNRVRPLLIADGGNIEVVCFDGDDVHVRLTGACADCPSAQMTLQFGVEAALREAAPNVRVIRAA
jgi:Fe-S cluster biogenesis protein NfuA